MRASSAAETRNVAALIQYAASGPTPVTSKPPAIGPTAQATFSSVWRIEFAPARSWSGTRLGRPSYTAGRKKPVAKPATAASATIWPALVVNGSTAKTTTRARSDAIISRLRGRRSTSELAAMPIRIAGRKSAMKSALTQVAESVRSNTSMVSATKASQVPRPEASVARASSVRAGRRPACGPVSGAGAAQTRQLAHPDARNHGIPHLPLDVAEHTPERFAEEGVLLGSANRDADSAGRTEAGRRPHDHAFLEQLLEEQPRVLPDLSEDEVRNRRAHRLEPVLPQRVLDDGPCCGVDAATPLEL